MVEECYRHGPLELGCRVGQASGMTLWLIWLRRAQLHKKQAAAAQGIIEKNRNELAFACPPLDSLFPSLLLSFPNPSSSSMLPGLISLSIYSICIQFHQSSAGTLHVLIGSYMLPRIHKSLRRHMSLSKRQCLNVGTFFSPMQ